MLTFTEHNILEINVAILEINVAHATTITQGYSVITL